MAISKKKLEATVGPIRNKIIQGVSINVFDLSKISKAGNDACLAGGTTEEIAAAIQAVVDVVGVKQ